MSESDVSQTQASPQPGANAYKVGYGRPPRHSRFGAGPLANRSGRRKKQRPHLAEVIKQELDATIVVVERGRKTRKTKLELTIQSWVDRVLQGDYKPLPQLMRIISKTDYFDEKIVGPFIGVVAIPKDFEEDRKNGMTDGKIYVFRDRVVRFHDARPGRNDRPIVETLRMATEEEMKNGRVG